MSRDPRGGKKIQPRRVTIVVACGVASLLCGGTAFADGPTRVTVLYIPSPKISAKDIARLSLGFNRALQPNRKLEVKDSDSMLADFAGDVPRAAVRTAESASEEGLQQLDDGRLEQAIETLQSASRQLTEVLPFIKKKQLAQTMLGLGVALAEAGKESRAREVFRDLIVWRPHLRYDTNIFPEDYLPWLERARKAVKRLRRGSVELVTIPPGARAFVNGLFAGVTPTTVYGLPVGTHYVTFKKVGFIKAGQTVTVSPYQQQTFTQELKRSEKFLLVEQTLAAARQEIGEARAGPAILDIGKVLFVDQLIFVAVDPGAENELRLSTDLYDLRSKLRLNHVSTKVNARTLAELPELARLLYLNMPYDGTVPAPPEPPAPAPLVQRPLYARWWFWTAVAAGVASGALAIALPLALRDPGCPSGRACVLITN